LVVSVQKTFENEKGIALVDKRNWVFQKEIPPENPLTPPARPEEKALPTGAHARDFCQTNVTLFRFSALTFNGHKIHFLPEWCRQVEGHRNCVVHGPLNLVNILDFWRDTAMSGSLEAVPKSISYRAMSPLYVGEPYRILLGQHADGQSSGRGEWTADIWDNYGKLGMKGKIQE
jgi:hydroxyacyl-ACP dehydratase HTD2-like protein with hotdog domain